MTRDWEDTFNFWAQPPSKTEEQRSENAIGAIRNAVNGSSKLKQRNIKVFPRAHTAIASTFARTATWT